MRRCHEKVIPVASAILYNTTRKLLELHSVTHNTITVRRLQLSWPSVVSAPAAWRGAGKPSACSPPGPGHRPRAPG
eukprot:scaffold96607_cov32-Prasinocladus_malaysianus.AAC.1